MEVPWTLKMKSTLGSVSPPKVTSSRELKVTSSPLRSIDGVQIPTKTQAPVLMPSPVRGESKAGSSGMIVRVARRNNCMDAQ